MGDPKIKIKLPPFIYEQFQRTRVPTSIMDKYYEVDNSKPRIEGELKEVNINCPWDDIEVVDD